MTQLSLFDQAPTGEAEVISGRVDRYGWQIKVSQFPDGLWRSAPDFYGKDWGFSWPLAMEREGHPSRAYAVEAAAGVIRFYLAKHPPSAINNKALADLDKLAAETAEPS